MMASTSDSFVISDMAPSSDNDDVDSLPSISSSILDSEDESDAQREWETSLEQLQLLLTMIIMPFAGKYLGRKFAYWSMLALVPGCFLGPIMLTGVLQAGRGIWNGCTTSRSGGQIRESLRPWELYKRLLRYDLVVSRAGKSHSEQYIYSFRQLIRGII